MPYDTKLVDRVRKYLVKFPKLKVEEKKMFRGLTFMVNDKMCVSISGENLMCRFDPSLQDEVAGKKGFRTMQMRGKEYKGFCYVGPEGFKKKRNLNIGSTFVWIIMKEQNLQRRKNKICHFYQL